MEKFKKVLKNRKFQILVALILLLIPTSYAAYYLSREGDVEPKDVSNLPQFILVRDYGTVMYLSAGEDEYELLSEGEISLPSGSKIRTSADSAAFAFLPDNSLITIESSTDLSIDFEDRNFSINQLTGNTWHRVQTLQQGDSYTVTTPTTVASVRGTSFAVSSNSDESIIAVTEDNVDVTKCEEADDMNVTTGELVQVKKYEEGCEIGKIETPKDIADDAWMSKNKDIDGLYNEIPKNDDFQEEFLKRIEDEGMDSPTDSGFPVDKDMDLRTPEIEITSPKDGSKTEKSTIELTGKVSFGSTLKINDKSAKVDSAQFRHTVTLKEGSNKFVLEATNPLNDKKSTKELTVIYEPKKVETPPAKKPTISLSGTANGDHAALSWSVKDFTPSAFKVIYDNQITTPTYPGSDAVMVSASTRSHALYLDSGTYYIRVCHYVNDKCDLYSNTVTVNLTVSFSITLSAGTSNMITWASSPSSPSGGYIILYSKYEIPTFGSTQTVSVNLPQGSTSKTLSATQGAATYKIIVCENVGGVCGTKSNMITMDLN